MFFPYLFTYLQAVKLYLFQWHVPIPEPHPTSVGTGCIDLVMLGIFTTTFTKQNIFWDVFIESLKFKSNWKLDCCICIPTTKDITGFNEVHIEIVLWLFFYNKQAQIWVLYCNFWLKCLSLIKFISRIRVIRTLFLISIKTNLH